MPIARVRRANAADRLIGRVYFVYFFRPPRFRGTFAPALRASDRPIAIACLRLVTRFPDRPLRRVPRFRSRMTFSTFFDAFLPYFAIEIPLRPGVRGRIPTLSATTVPVRAQELGVRELDLDCV
jgi:hypothetical protein